MNKILYLISHDRYATKMSRGARFDTIRALGRRRDVALYWHGEGWAPGQDVPYGDLDLVIAYKPHDHPALIDRTVAPRRIGASGWIFEAPREDQQYTPLALIFNEVHEGILQNDFNGSHASIVVCHHENDMAKFDAEQVSVWHIPHCAERSIFWPTSKPTPRSIDCLVSGVQSPEIYPLRNKFKQLVKSGRLPGEVRKHPGYRLKNAAECERQMKDYAAHLRRAKIALCCTSTRKYALAKIVEAMMAGCLVVCDMPDDKHFESTLGKHLALVEADWSPERLEQAVKWWLDHPGALYDRARAGQAAALASFTMEDWAEQFMEHFSQWREVVSIGRV